LLYVAWGSFRAVVADDEVRFAPNAPASPIRLVMRGVLLNGLNPKAGLAWAAVMALGGASDGATVWAVVGTCAVMGLAIYSAYAFLFAAPGMRRAYSPMRRWVDGAVALGFGAAGAAVLLRRGEG